MPLIVHASKQTHRVWRFVEHDLKVVEQMGRFYKTKEVQMRFINENLEMMIGYFTVEWFPGWLVFKPAPLSTPSSLEQKKTNRRKKELKLGSFLVPKYRTFFRKLIKVQIGYAHKTEI